MACPGISHAQFLALSPLQSGSPLRVPEICEATSQSSSAAIERSISRLAERGFVLRTEGLYRHADGTLRKGLAVQITDAGRQAWQEAADFYLWFIEKFAQRWEPQSSLVRTSQRPFRHSYRKPRIPTKAEDRAIRRVAHSRLILAADGLRSAPHLQQGELFGLGVEDIDFAGKTMIIRNRHGNKRTEAISDELLPVLRHSIGMRTCGSVFLSATGKAMTPSNFIQQWRYNLNRAGVPPSVVCRPHSLKARRRRASQQSQPQPGSHSGAAWAGCGAEVGHERTIQQKGQTTQTHKTIEDCDSFSNEIR